MTTSDPSHPFPAPAYWGPLASLVEYSELPGGPPNCHGDLQLLGSFDHVAGRNRKIRVPVRPRCHLKAALKPCRVPMLDPNTSEAHGNVPLAALAALRVPTRLEKCLNAAPSGQLISTKQPAYSHRINMCHMWGPVTCCISGGLK